MGNNVSTKENVYTEFVIYLCEYMTKHTYDALECRKSVAFYDEICHIISLYCDPRLNLLYDFITYDDTIRSIGIETHEQNVILHDQYPKFNIKDDKPSTSLWLSFKTQTIHYCHQTNTISRPVPNTICLHLEHVNTDHVPDTLRIISNIKSCFVLQTSFQHHLFIANNEYSKNYNTLIGSPPNFGHWDGFMIPFCGHIGPPDVEFKNHSRYGIHFIITELCNLLWRISICSVATVSIGMYQRMAPKRTKHAVLYEFKKKNRHGVYTYTELYSNIRIKQQKFNKKHGAYEDTYAPYYIYDIQTIFEWKRHILFLYDAHIWVLYVPLQVFTVCECVNLQSNYKGSEQNEKNTKRLAIGTNDLYKKNADYLIFMGKTYLNEKPYAQIGNAIANDWMYRKYFNGFDSVIHDAENGRFYVAKQSKLYHLDEEDLSPSEKDDVIRSVKSSKEQIHFEDKISDRLGHNETSMGFETNNYSVKSKEFSKPKKAVTIMGAAKLNENVSFRIKTDNGLDNDNEESEDYTKTNKGVSLLGHACADPTKI
eukprot:65409_1